VIIWKIGFTLDFGIILNPPFGITTMLLKLHAVGHIPYSNIKIRKLNTPIIFKIMHCSSLYIESFVLVVPVNILLFTVGSQGPEVGMIAIVIDKE